MEKEVSTMFQELDKFLEKYAPGRLTIKDSGLDRAFIRHDGALSFAAHDNRLGSVITVRFYAGPDYPTVELVNVFNGACLE